MDFLIYQYEANKTSGNKDHHNDFRLAVAGLGLTGEAGEVADHIKKAIGHGHALDTERVKKELGDVLWYVAELCTALQLSMEDVAIANVEKLQKRYPEGFSSERSINRGEQ